MRPTALIAVCRASHARLIESVDRISDEGLERPSLLPGWSRADVVAWLALKSRSHSHLFDGALVGEVRSQFPVAYDQPAAVRREASRPAPELRSGLAASFADLQAAWDRLPDGLWSAEAITTAGPRPMDEVVARHLRDAEAHHVDLDVGYTPSDWPAEFVDLELRKRLRDLEGRADRSALLAWLLGRGGPPELRPW